MNSARTPPRPGRSWLARLLGHGDGGASAGRDARQPTQRLVLPAPPTAEEIAAALDRTEALVAGGIVPAAVASRVRRIAATVRQTLPRLDKLAVGSADSYAVVATATDYLPEAVGGYLRLPRQWADSRPVDAGRTSLMVLIDQLDLLALTMDQILDAAVRVDADALVAHGRFLQEKFGTPAQGGGLNLGAVPPDPGRPTAPGALP